MHRRRTNGVLAVFPSNGSQFPARRRRARSELLPERRLRTGRRQRRRPHRRVLPVNGKVVLSMGAPSWARPTVAWCSGATAARVPGRRGRGRRERDRVQQLGRRRPRTSRSASGMATGARPRRRRGGRTGVRATCGPATGTATGRRDLYCDSTDGTGRGRHRRPQADLASGDRQRARGDDQLEPTRHRARSPTRTSRRSSTRSPR